MDSQRVGSCSRPSGTEWKQRRQFESLEQCVNGVWNQFVWVQCVLICKCSEHAESCLSCSQVWHQDFFTERKKSTSEFPIRIEKRREKLTDSLCDFTSIDSVLLSFNWSLLCVVHNLTSMIQFCMVSIVVWIWSGTVSLYNWLSSANAWCWIECFLISLNRGCVYRTKRTGPKTEPWGTPKLRGASSDLSPLTVTIWVLSERYDLNQDKAESLIPKVCSSRWRRML